MDFVKIYKKTAVFLLKVTLTKNVDNLCAVSIILCNIHKKIISLNRLSNLTLSMRFDIIKISLISLFAHFF